MPALLLRDQDKQRFLAILAKHLPDVTVWAYGSRVNGDAHDASDLDIVLRTSDLSAISVSALANLREALSESNIPILIDIRDWARLPEAFHTEILRNYVELKVCNND